jgi:hypothetical protein
MNKIILLIVIILLTMCSHVFAYIGPGMGGGVVLGALGVIGAIFLALVGILYYPIKRLVKNKKNNT